MSYFFHFPITGKPGAFFFYAILASVGWVLFYFKLPETKGLGLEDAESLFANGGSGNNKEGGKNYDVLYSRITNPLADE